MRQATLPAGQRPSPCYENPERSSSGLPRAGRPFLIFAALGCLAAAGPYALGCSGSRSEGSRPEPALAASPEAQRDYRIFRDEWRRTAPSDRSKLEPSARAFLKAHPDDGRAPLVRIYLALVLMDQKRLDEARRVLGPLEQSPVGTTRDFAHVARAALLLSEGKPRASRLELEPLRGKLIDAGERLLYGELLVKTALVEDHLADAVLDMRWWLNDVEPSDVPEVEARVRGYLERFDRAELEEARAWLVRDKSTRTQASQAIDAWLERQLTDLLVHSAVRDQDSALARRLLTSATAEISDAATRDKLRQLASGGELARRIVGRTIGLVLSLDTPRARVRSSQLSAGVTAALGLPQAASDPDSVKLLVKDDAEGMEAALGALAGAGASILIGGVDEQGAAQAVTFGETAAIVVIVATHVEGGSDDWEYGFSVGEPLETQRSVLEGALRREGSRHWVEVNWAPGDASCANQFGSAGKPRFPVAQWKRSGADALLLLGDEHCSRDAIEEARAAGRFKYALGLESAGLLPTAEASGTAIFVRAGAFPPGVGARADDGGARRWYEALGRDAANLAQSALAPFPSETVDDARIVAELHTKARDRLLSTTVKLETSHQDGFAGQHQLPRELRPVVGKARNNR